MTLSPESTEPVEHVSVATSPELTGNTVAVLTFVQVGGNAVHSEIHIIWYSYIIIKYLIRVCTFATYYDIIGEYFSPSHPVPIWILDCLVVIVLYILHTLYVILIITYNVRNIYSGVVYIYI